MKLITELNEEVSTQIVEDTSGKRNMYLNGVYLQAGIINRNNRLYPPHILERETGRYIKEAIERNCAWGELQHPNSPSVNLKESCIRITEMKKVGNDYHGKALVLDTPNGKIVQSLIESGGYLGVSSRGMGSLKKDPKGHDIVQDDFFLAVGADVVANPSAPSAWVNGVMESVNWRINELGEWVMETQSEIRKQVHTMTKQELTEQQTSLFQKFLQRVDENVFVEKLAKKSNVSVEDAHRALKAARVTAKLLNRHNDHGYVYRKTKEILGIHSAKDDD